MRSLLRRRCFFALLVSAGFFVAAPSLFAIPENQIRSALNQAEEYEKKSQWEEARQIYESLLGQPDPGLKIRARYHQVMRRCWQARRPTDLSYRKEVLSLEYAQALRLHNVITKELLDGSIEKNALDPTKLFHKGLEELDAALSDPLFLDLHVPADKRGFVPEFRAMLKKTWGNKAAMSRKEAAKHIGDLAMAAEIQLNLNATVAIMEMACGACYAIDEYTVYLTPNQLRELMQTLAPRTEAIGVGLVLTIRESRIVVQRVIPNGPADRSDDVKVNDEIISVNKKAVTDLPLQMVRAMLEGPAGSMVEIELLTPGETVRSIALPRQRPLNPDLLAYSLMAPNSAIGVLKINHFAESTAQDIQDALAELSAKNGIKSLIVDLRGNGGGIFDVAIDAAGQFLSTGIITSTVNQDTKQSKIYHAKNPKAVTLPLVVLVDGDTASAAEVLAGALKDNDRAILIGQTTFGKGCTQRVLKLPNALGGVPTGGMKLTVERLFSPKGTAYSGRGVVPHFLIEDRMEPMSQANLMGDAALAKAIDELNRLMAMQK